MNLKKYLNIKYFNKKEPNYVPWVDTSIQQKKETMNRELDIFYVLQEIRDILQQILKLSQKNLLMMQEKNNAMADMDRDLLKYNLMLLEQADKKLDHKVHNGPLC